MRKRKQPLARTKNTYTANDIQELDDKQHLRKRPNLTLGEETGNDNHPFSSMKRTCVREIYENSVDEALQNHADRIRVTFFPDDSFLVQDNGRGIPVDVNTTTGKNGILQTIGTLRSGRNFDSFDNKKSTGTNGLGASAVAVFSKRFDVTVFRNNKQHSLSFKYGDPGFFTGEGADAQFTPATDKAELKVSKDTRGAAEKRAFKTGTLIKVWLDTSIFPTPYPYDRDDIIERLRATSYLIPNTTIDVTNHTPEGETQEYTFSNAGGVKALVETIVPTTPVTDVVPLEGVASYSERATIVDPKDPAKTETVTVDREVSFQMGFTYVKKKPDYTVRSYVNTIFTQDNGVHVTGFERALRDVLNHKIKRLKLIPKGYDEPSAADYREGLTAVVSVFLQEPGYTGQSKDKLTGGKVQNALTAAVTEQLTAWVAAKRNSEAVTAICSRVAATALRRQKEQEAKEVQKAASNLSAAPLPAKLKDCERTSGGDLELYICEGDSALSTMTAARFSENQAVFPVRGKPMSAINNSMAALVANKEIQGIINTLGAGVGNDFDITKMRYDRVFIAVDADEDGNDIACLIYLLFWRLFRPVVEENRLFMLQPPLFVFSHVTGLKPGERLFAQNEVEKDKMVAELKAAGKKFTLSRMKGLGEMNQKDMTVTSMDKDTRSVIQINYTDVPVLEETIVKLFDKKQADARKEWLLAAGVEDENFLDVEDTTLEV
jgi:DNA topoisomerase (ATP-hydrolyzing)